MLPASVRSGWLLLVLRRAARHRANSPQVAQQPLESHVSFPLWPASPSTVTNELRNAALAEVLGDEAHSLEPTAKRTDDTKMLTNGQ